MKNNFIKTATLLGISLLLLVLNVNAQNTYKWGILAGANISTSSEKNIGWGTGFHIGTMYQHSLNEQFSLQPRLYFSFTETRGKDNSVFNNSLYNQWSLSLPVMLSYGKIICKHTSAHINVGPYVQYAFFGKYRIPQSDNQRSAFWHSDMGDKFTWGGQVGAQIVHRNLLLGVDYKHSLRKNQNYIASDPGKERSVIMSLGYIF